MIKMKALKGFTNARISGPRADGSVLPGEDFGTDWLHAKDLVANQLAEPHDPKELEREPNEMVARHSGLSVAQHTRINERRGKAAADKAAADDKAAAADKAV